VSPSRSSSASRSPVDAPDGTAARPTRRLERHVDFDGRIAARIQDLAAVHLCDLQSCTVSGSRSCYRRRRAIRLGLELQRLLAERSDERLVVGRDDDDAGVGDGVAAAISLGVVADQRAARDEHVAVDDRARMRACRPTRTPGIRMHSSMWQKLWTRTFGQSTLP
jgi:hypothetical protein